jgi:hypothetical protein
MRSEIPMKDSIKATFFWDVTRLPSGWRQYIPRNIGNIHQTTLRNISKKTKLLHFVSLTTPDLISGDSISNWTRNNKNVLSWLLFPDVIMNVIYYVFLESKIKRTLYMEVRLSVSYPVSASTQMNGFSWNSIWQISTKRYPEILIFRHVYT